ncbi:UNVERIFIED_CONTAM: Phytochrome A [Sesamum calycinum]|uniref:Phytochrome A n=1 Tax=Sesamum calycinum TaxID=2727403 RepID=A0AAW2L7N2_9LAMI
MKFNDLKIDGIQELKAVISEIVRLIETAFVPILVVDAGGGGLVNGWNTKIFDLIDLPVDEAIGRHLLSLVEDSFVDKINKITDDTDFDSIMEGYLDLPMVEFELHDVLITSISQVMMKSISKLQQVLVTLLLVSVNATLSGGQLGLATTLTKDSLGETV